MRYRDSDTNTTRAVDSRFRGKDEIQGARPRHRPSRESGNPLEVSEPQKRTTPNSHSLLKGARGNPSVSGAALDVGAHGHAPLPPRWRHLRPRPRGYRQSKQLTASPRLPASISFAKRRRGCAAQHSPEGHIRLLGSHKPNSAWAAHLPPPLSFPSRRLQPALSCRMGETMEAANLSLPAAAMNQATQHHQSCPNQEHRRRLWVCANLAAIQRCAQCLSGTKTLERCQKVSRA